MISIIKDYGKKLFEQEISIRTLKDKYGISYTTTLQRLEVNLSVSTRTRNQLCEILDCQLKDITEFIPDEMQ